MEQKIPKLCRTCLYFKDDKCEKDFNRASDKDDFFADRLEDVEKCPDYVDDRYSIQELLSIDILG